MFERSCHKANNAKRNQCNPTLWILRASIQLGANLQFFLLVEDHDRHAGPITASARQSSNSAEPSHFLGNVGGSLCALAKGVLADLQIESGVTTKREDRTDRRELLTDGEPWVSPRKGKTRQ